MRNMLVILLAASILAAGCTNEQEQPSTASSPTTETPTATPDVPPEIEIYSAVIRRLVTKDHTFGRGKSPFKQIYVINGPVTKAGEPRGNLDSDTERFPPDVVVGIEEELEDLPPITFVINGNDVRSGKQGMGGVKNNGVIISLGPIEFKKERVHVSNGLWCGGLCGQWLTYVLAEDGGQWRITGTTGTYVIS